MTRGDCRCFCMIETTACEVSFPMARKIYKFERTFEKLIGNSQWPDENAVRFSTRKFFAQKNRVTKTLICILHI